MPLSLNWRLALPAGLVLTAAGALAGCSSSKPAPTASLSPAATVTASTAATPAPAAAPAGVAVTLKDFAVVATPPSIAAGKVTFAVQNAGVSPHEFVVVKSDLAPESLPQVNQKTVDERQVQVSGKIEPFDGGSQRELVVDLQPGRYVLLCNVPSHYISGMHTAFTVTAAR